MDDKEAWRYATYHCADDLLKAHKRIRVLEDLIEKSQAMGVNLQREIDALKKKVSDYEKQDSEAG